MTVTSPPQSPLPAVTAKEPLQASLPNCSTASEDRSTLKRTRLSRVSKAVVRGSKAVFTIDVLEEKLVELAAEAEFSDGSRRRVALGAPPATNSRTCAVRLNEDWPPVVSISLIGRVSETWFLLEQQEKECFLHRLMSRTLKDVNDNLRWQNRITDLETRFFSVRNSLRGNREDFEFWARCLVSVGYQGLEQENKSIIDWCRSELADYAKNSDGKEETEAYLSLLIFWLHLAIYDQDADRFGGISKRLRDVPKEAIPAIAVFNYLHMALLLGAWHLALGHNTEAYDLFDPSDDLFKRAALDYPRALINYKELTTMASKTYFCQVGRTMAKGHALPASGEFAPLSPTLAWQQGSRLRVKEAKDRLLDSYISMCTGRPR